MTINCKPFIFVLNFMLQLVNLETACTKIGELWPRVFPGSTVPPKIDTLVFSVVPFARKWGTLGGVGEERIEAKHQIFNRHERVLAPVRDKGKVAVLTMRRVKALHVAKKKTGGLSDPKKRKWKDEEARKKKFPGK